MKKVYVHVGRKFQMVGVEVSEHLGRVGKQVVIPVPTIPSVDVAVHVNAQHVNRNAVLPVVVDHLPELPVGVEPVPRVPVAVGVAWQHGNRSGKRREILQSGLIVVAVGEKVPVLRSVFRTVFDPFSRYRLSLAVLAFDEHRPFRVINKCPPVSGKDTVLQLDGLAFILAVHHCSSLDGIVGVACAFKVFFLLQSWFPTETERVGL